MGWGQNNVNLALENDDTVIPNGGETKKGAKKWGGFSKSKPAEVNEKKEKKGDEKTGEEEGEEGTEEKKLEEQPVGLFETVRRALIDTVQYVIEHNNKAGNPLQLINSILSRP